MENNSKLNIKEFLDKDEQKDLLRFLTAGSVDDGKSTLIGRLLFDSKKLYEDQLDALERDSKRMGNAGDHIRIAAGWSESRTCCEWKTMYGNVEKDAGGLL